LNAFTANLGQTSAQHYSQTAHEHREVCIKLGVVVIASQPDIPSHGQKFHQCSLSVNDAQVRHRVEYDRKPRAIVEFGSISQLTALSAPVCIRVLKNHSQVRVQLESILSERFFEKLRSGQRAWIVDCDTMSALRVYNCRLAECQNQD
jgi:hypothetical protein